VGSESQFDILNNDAALYKRFALKALNEDDVVQLIVDEQLTSWRGDIVKELAGFVEQQSVTGIELLRAIKEYYNNKKSKHEVSLSTSSSSESLSQSSVAVVEEKSSVVSDKPHTESSIDHLQQALQRRHLQLHRVPADGNCGLHAIIHQLPLIENKDSSWPATHSDLRKAIVDYEIQCYTAQINNKRVSSQYNDETGRKAITRSGQLDTHSWKEWTDLMALDGTFITDIELSAFCQLYSIDIDCIGDDGRINEYKVYGDRSGNIPKLQIV
jgi:hypothetical protein